MPPGGPANRPLTDHDVVEVLGRIATERLNLPPDRVAGLGLDTPLIAGLQLDSLMMVVLLAELEERFGLEFDVPAQDRLAEVATVGDLVRFIQEQTPEAR